MSKDTISVNMNVYDIPILVEQLEKANKEIKRLKEEYVMLQNASDKVEEEKDKEVERLKDLCNKYEEEHKTAFEEWKKAINIIKEVREKINKDYWWNWDTDNDKIIREILDKIGSDKNE